MLCRQERRDATDAVRKSMASSARDHFCAHRHIQYLAFEKQTLRVIYCRVLSHIYTDRVVGSDQFFILVIFLYAIVELPHSVSSLYRLPWQIIDFQWHYWMTLKPHRLIELISPNDKLSIPINQDNCSGVQWMQWATLYRQRTGRDISVKCWVMSWLRELVCFVSLWILIHQMIIPAFQQYRV